MKSFFIDLDTDPHHSHEISKGYDPGCLHFHTHYEIIIVRSGDMRITNSERTVDYNGPCIILNAPYSFHEIISNAEKEYDRYEFHFSDSCINRIETSILDIYTLYRSPLAVIPLTESSENEIYPILGALSDEPDRGNLNCLIIACMLEIAQHNFKSSIVKYGDVENPPGNVHFDKTSSNRSYISNVISYINTHFSENISAEELSKMCFISRQKLDSDFKKSMGITLKQYIINVRIANSVKMLYAGERIADITYACGFANESHFIRIFKQRIGVSPLQYRKNSGSTLS